MLIASFYLPSGLLSLWGLSSFLSLMVILSNPFILQDPVAAHYVPLPRYQFDQTLFGK